MDRRIAKLWIAELRSGAYKRGRYRLRSGTFEDMPQFCCLGVLCNLHAKLHPEIAAAQQSKLSYMGSAQILPREVQMWAGMADSNGLRSDKRPLTGFSSAYTHTSLTSINDRTEMTFDEIADVIKANWKKL